MVTQTKAVNVRLSSGWAENNLCAPWGLLIQHWWIGKLKDTKV